MFGQFADGVFQASLAGTILFNPERQAHAGDIAAGFAVLLLPYSLPRPVRRGAAGPLVPAAGACSARTCSARCWCAGVAAEIGAGVHGQPFYLSALAGDLGQPLRPVRAVGGAAARGAVRSAGHRQRDLGDRRGGDQPRSAAAARSRCGLALGDGNGGYALVALGGALFYAASAGAALRFGLRPTRPGRRDPEPTATRCATC